VFEEFPPNFEDKQTTEVQMPKRTTLPVDNQIHQRQLEGDEVFSKKKPKNGA